MQSFKDFMGNHKITAHSLVVAWAFVYGLYVDNHAFHAYVQSLYSLIPVSIHSFIAGAIVPALVYYRSQKSS